jgi:Family of unknown function (DUF6152)
MKDKLILMLGVIFGLLMVSGSLSAHHGKGAFETDKLTVVKGTVTKFAFINPHALIYVDAKGEKGDLEHWIAESNSLNHLHRGGYDKDSLKPGDQVIVTGQRSRNGTFTLDLQCQECSVKDPRGKVLLGYYF